MNGVISPCGISQLSRVEGFVVYVGNATVGKKIRIKVTEVADTFTKAIIV